MSNELTSYHIDAGGETELDPKEYKVALLVYRYGYDEDDLRQRGDEFIASEYKRLSGN